jgi:hypothetical protein|nr:MAG TPA: hypothetical protein [Caudoviricetes sp.]
MAVNAIRVPVVKDNQIFEYSDTLSLPVDATQAHLEPGDVVVINKGNGIAGILQTKVRPTTAEAEKTLGEVLTAPTYGLNGPGYASVRVAGGVFELTGKVAADAKAGDPVYAKAATGAGIKPVITTVKTGADVIIGWLKEPVASASVDQKMQVVLAPAKTA